MNRGTILIRVDGSAQGGMGRVSRCLALANALQRRRYQMTFVSKIDNSGWPDRIRRFRHTVAKAENAAGSKDDRQDFVALIASSNPVAVVTDSPRIDEDYLAEVADRVPLLISLDESAQIRFPSKLVINPTLGHGIADYACEPGVQVVAGERFAMVRSEFRRARTVRAQGPGGPPRALIALGGGEVGRDTIAYAKALLHSKAVERVDAVTGAGNEHKEEIQGLAAELGGAFSATCDARDMGPRMTKAHILITGGGNTALEAACVGIPMVIVSRHPHHELNATRLEEIGVAQYLGSHKNVKPSALAEAVGMVLEDKFERRTMSRSGRMLIDGRGPDRIVTATELLLRQARRSRTLAAAA